MTTRTKLILAAILLIIGGAVYQHNKNEAAERDRIEYIRRTMEINAEGARRSNEEFQRILADSRRLLLPPPSPAVMLPPQPPAPPQRNPQLDELNWNLEKINRSIQDNEQAIRDAAIHP